MRDRLIELLKAVDRNPQVRCPNHDKDTCEGCKYDLIDVCDMPAIVADHLLAEGVIVPPVKVGQTVYSKKCNAYVVEGIHYKNDRFMFGGNRENKEGAPQSVWFENDIGKTVFLTRGEAEKALAEREKPVEIKNS